MNDPDLIGAATAADILGLSVATINRMAADGHLPTAGKLPGRTGAHIFTRAAIVAHAERAAA